MQLHLNRNQQRKVQVILLLFLILVTQVSKVKKVQLHHAEDGTWTCETTVDGKYAGKSCSVVTALRATS